MHTIMVEERCRCQEGKEGNKEHTRATNVDTTSHKDRTKEFRSQRQAGSISNNTSNIKAMETQSLMQMNAGIRRETDGTIIVTHHRHHHQAHVEVR